MATPVPGQDRTLWDDAAIAQSWDRVVSDYKTFHDIRARGGTVDDLPALLKTTSDRQETTRDAKPETNHRRAGLEAGPGRGDDSGRAAATDEGSRNPGGRVNTAGEAGGSSGALRSPSGRGPGTREETKSQAFSGVASETNQPVVPGLLSPQTVLGGADENLKKLLMSWYYAGYYTGLYEGQQRQLQLQQEAQQAEEAEQGQDSLELDMHDDDGGVDDYYEAQP